VIPNDQDPSIHLDKLQGLPLHEWERTQFESKSCSLVCSPASNFIHIFDVYACVIVTLSGCVDVYACVMFMLVLFSRSQVAGLNRDMKSKRLHIQAENQQQNMVGTGSCFSTLFSLLIISCDQN
jgi:hypothetical protein